MSFAGQTRQRTGPVLPLAAMVDVLFLLLIFFMTASAFREQEQQIDVSLPGTESDQSSGASPTAVYITVTDEGRIFVGDQPYSLEALTQLLNEMAREFADEVVVIRGDREGKWGLGVRILDLAYAAGFRDVRIGTTKLESEL